MKHAIVTALKQALDVVCEQSDLSESAKSTIDDVAARFTVERARDPRHGDYAANLAMLLAKQLGKKPRDIAESLVAALPQDAGLIASAEVAGPGFINFRLAEQAYHDLVRDIVRSGAAFGRSTIGSGTTVNVEFVSANPTGPLHVGHGRGAAYGDSLARLLREAGFEVTSEYYLNDAGRQMDILALSVWLRYREKAGGVTPFPARGYRGAYIQDVADALRSEHLTRFDPANEVAEAALAVDLPGDDEAVVDTLVSRLREMLGDADYLALFQFVRDRLVAELGDDLAQFGVHYDVWFSEQSLHDSGEVARAVTRLQSSQHIYEQDGALWFRSTEFGDDKDRVVRRANGVFTYFASDIAYLVNKAERGFDRMIYIWGADHHGYIPRLHAVWQALGAPGKELKILLVQFATLIRGGNKVQMTTRGGEFVTLQQLREEVGKDAARFFYAQRRPEQHMDFDLDLAVSQSNDNPVYYIQYAHARICSVLKQLEQAGTAIEDMQLCDADLNLLDSREERNLMRALARYPETIESAALAYEPHQVGYLLRDIANDFHTYYNAHRFIDADDKLRNARLTLVTATRWALHNGLALLGVEAPRSM